MNDLNGNTIFVIAVNDSDGIIEMKAFYNARDALTQEDKWCEQYPCVDYDVSMRELVVT